MRPNYPISMSPPQVVSLHIVGWGYTIKSLLGECLSLTPTPPDLKRSLGDSIYNIR